MANKLDECMPLGQKYTLWFHNPNDINWKIDSYHKIITFSTAEEYWRAAEHLSSKLVEKGMIFLMKEGIEPTWEDKMNMSGGCISFKIANNDSCKVWINLMAHLVSSNLENHANGVSISPKKNFNIVKIWTNSVVNISSYTFPKTLIIHNEDAIFNANKDNIQKDNEKMTYYEERTKKNY
jgi:hypothetical protein